MEKKKLFISGSSGMVGKNLLNHIQTHSYEIITTSSKSLNLLNYVDVENFLNKHKPDIIVHAAGVVGGIHKNIKEPVRFLSDNTCMGFNLINASLKNNIKYFLNLGSSCMFPRNIPSKISEDMLLSNYLEPTNEGYAISKIATAKLCSYVNKEYPDYSYKTLVPCNLYGPYDSFNPENSHLLPSIIHKIHNAKINGHDDVVIWGDGKAKREFMYVEDLSEFIIRFIEKIESLPDILNIGLGHDWTVLDYYQIAAEVIGYDGSFSFDYSKPTGMERKLLDVTQANNLGWKASTSLRKGILKTYEFYLMSLEK